MLAVHKGREEPTLLFFSIFERIVCLEGKHGHPNVFTDAQNWKFGVEMLTRNLTIIYDLFLWFVTIMCEDRGGYVLEDH